MPEDPARGIEDDVAAGIRGHGAQPAQGLGLIQLHADAPRRGDDAREVLGRLARLGHRSPGVPPRPSLVTASGRAQPGRVDIGLEASLESARFPR